MRLEIRNRVTMLKDVVTAEVAASQSSRRAWMMIRPTEDGARVMLVEFEHDAAVDTDAWISPDHILDRRRTDYDNLTELLSALEGRGIETDAFDAPWKMDYPL